MTSPQAILTGAALIAAAVILSNGSEAVSQTAGDAYMVVAADRIAYELDTVTGSIRGCVRMRSAGAESTVCDPWIPR